MSASTRIREDHQKYYAVKKIIGVHIDNNNTYYQIEWEPTWEDFNNLIGCEQLIKEFWTKRSAQCFCKFPNIKNEPMDSSYDNTTASETLGDSQCNSGGKETISVQRNLLPNSSQANDASIFQRKSRMTLSNISVSPLKRKLTESTARAMKSSSTLSQMKWKLSRIVSPTNSKPRKLRGFGMRATRGARNSMNSLKREQAVECISSNLPTGMKEFTQEIQSEDSISMIVERSDVSSVEKTKTLVVASDEEEDKESDDETDSFSNTSNMYESYTNIFDKALTEDTEKKESVEKSVVPNFINYIGEFKCHLCGFVSIKKEELKKHYLQKHSLTKKPLKIHYPCGQCGKQFKVKSHLVSHLMNHTKLGLNPYKCTLCSESFSNIHDLESHHFIHEFSLIKVKQQFNGTLTNDKRNNSQYQCVSCKRNFSNNRALIMHTRNCCRSSKSDSKPMAIKSISNNLQTRTTDNSNSTKIKQRKSSKNQSIHAKIKAKYQRQKKIARKVKSRSKFHHNDILHCPYCPRKYNNKNRTGLSTLNLHMELKHKDKAFDVAPGTEAFSKCPYCTRLFINIKALGNHVVNIHGVDKSKVPEISKSILSRKIKRGKKIVTSEKTENFKKDPEESSLKSEESKKLVLNPTKKTTKVRRSIADRLRDTESFQARNRKQSVRRKTNNSMFSLRRKVAKGNTNSENDSDAFEKISERRRPGRPKSRTSGTFKQESLSDDKKECSSEKTSNSKQKYQCKHCLRAYKFLHNAKKHMKMAHPNVGICSFFKV